MFRTSHNFFLKRFRFFFRLFLCLGFSNSTPHSSVFCRIRWCFVFFLGVSVSFLQSLLGICSVPLTHTTVACGHPTCQCTKLRFQLRAVFFFWSGGIVVKRRRAKYSFEPKANTPLSDWVFFLPSLCVRGCQQWTKRGVKSAKIEAKVTTFSHEVKSCALICERVCACVGVVFVGEEFVLICLLDERETALGCRTRERAHSFRAAGTTHAKQSVTRQTLTDGKTAKKKKWCANGFRVILLLYSLSATKRPPPPTLTRRYMQACTRVPAHMHMDTFWRNCVHPLVRWLRTTHGALADNNHWPLDSP